MLKDGTVQLAVAVSHFKARIAAASPLVASEEALEAAAPLINTQGHTLMHAFGEALYQTGGSDYIRYCGSSSVADGCYHQVVGLAAQEHGLAILPKLVEECDEGKSDAYPCNHAMWHALVSYFGYAQAGLDAALAQCANAEHRAACANGAFMEYNLREMTAAEGPIEARPLEQERLYSPCSDIRSDFKADCFFQLPLWWYRAGSAERSTGEAFERFAAQCAALPRTSERSACAMGLSYPVIEQVRYRPADAEALCVSATRTRPDAVRCITGTARRLAVSGNSETLPCDLFALSAKEALYCAHSLSLPLGEALAAASSI